MHLDTVLFWDVLWCTPPKTNMEPENTPLQKGETPTNHQFLGSVLIFGSVLHMGRFVLFGVHIGKHPTRYSDNNASSPSQLPPLAARTVCPQSWLLDAIGQSSTKLIFRAPWVVGMVDVVVSSHDGSMGIMLAWYMKIYMENHTLSRHMLVNMPWVLWGSYGVDWWLVMIGVSLKHSEKLNKNWTQQMEALEHDFPFFSWVILGSSHVHFPGWDLKDNMYPPWN